MPQRCHFHWSLCLAVLLCVAPVLACKETDPQNLFNGCVIAGTMYMGPSQTKEITCDLNAETLLVALPSDRVSVDELVRKSVPRTAAEMLYSSELAGSRWCFLAPQQPANATTSERAVCDQSETPIERLSVARGRQFRLTLTRVGDAPVSVTKVSGTHDASQ
jgi:hypothetical protein